MTTKKSARTRAVASKAESMIAGARRKPPAVQRTAPRPAAGPMYEKLLKSAGQLLGEVGFEKLTTNAICERAGVTPPTLYWYFNDKYDVLGALARKLLKKQNDAFAAWMFQGGTWKNPGNRVAALEEWFRTSVAVTRSEPGAIWTLRALRALPNLAHIRLESQRQASDQMLEFYGRIYPDIPRQLLWYRLRIVSEFGFVVDELALEEDRIPPDVLFREAARVLGIPYDYDPPSRR